VVQAALLRSSREATTKPNPSMATAATFQYTDAVTPSIAKKYTAAPTRPRAMNTTTPRDERPRFTGLPGTEGSLT
jgi:hypothetical protein